MQSQPSDRGRSGCASNAPAHSLARPPAHRYREKMQRKRNELIETLIARDPTYRPPSDYRPEKKWCKLSIPHRQYPGYNFIGLIIGPRGNTQQRMQAETNTKIAIRCFGCAGVGDRRGRLGYCGRLVCTIGGTGATTGITCIGAISATRDVQACVLCRSPCSSFSCRLNKAACMSLQNAGGVARSRMARLATPKGLLVRTRTYTL